MITEKRQKEIDREAKRVSRELDSLSAYERLERSINKHIELDPDDKVPKALILNKRMFIKWFKWCKENNWNYKEFHGIQIVLKKEAPFEVAVRYSKVES